jgi:hypothetical protein
MNEKTLKEVADAFQNATNKKWLADPRTEVLVTLLRDVLMEVEALREAMLQSDAGSGGKRSAYARVYRETALLTHNSAGPSSGLDKLLARFYPPESKEGRIWREALMLRRLGLCADEVEEYKRDATEAGLLT